MNLWTQVCRPFWRRRCGTGIWAALYIYLFFRMLKENATREERYQQMIDHLSNDIADGIEDIQNPLDALSPAASGKT